MRISTTQLLREAPRGGFAIGAFNVYMLAGVRAVASAAETLMRPVMLQVLPRALELGGPIMEKIRLFGSSGQAGWHIQEIRPRTIA